MSVEKKYYTVDSIDTVKLLFEHITACEVLAFDTETDSLNPRKGTVVGWSISGQEGVGFYMPVQTWNVQSKQLEECVIGGQGAHTLAKKLIQMLQGKRLVMHNASFDIRFVKNYYKIDLLDSLWIDTSLLVHTLNEDGAFGFGNPFGLKSIASMHQQELGLNIESAANQEQIELKESIKRNGGSTNKDTFEIYKADLDILSRYAAADTDLTLRICNLYLAKLKKENLERFFFEEEVMPIYKEVTIPMEELGVDIDMELLNKISAEIEQDLIENKKVVMKSLLDTDEGREWVVDTAITTFPPSNKGTWAQELVAYFKLPLPKSKSGKYSITAKGIKSLEDCPAKTFLQTGQMDVLDPFDITRISMKLWKESNDNEYINIQSKKHLGEIVFKYMKVKAKSKTDKGADQFDMDMLEGLSKKYAWAENLRVYNKLLKIKSTYIDRFRDGAEDGKYYFYFKQNGTVSGRYGSDAQQLPKPKEEGEDADIIVKYNNVVRALLIAGKGRKVIDADYESLEPHCFASVSGDVNLQEIFNKGWDFYSTVAIRTERLDEQVGRYPNGVSPDKKAPNYLKKLDPAKRNQAKAYSLGIAYGMEAFALSKTLNISQDEADKLVKGYLDGFPQLKQWRENSRKQVKEHGFIANYVGRIRHLPKVKAIYREHGDDIMDWKYKKQLEREYSKEEVMSIYRDYRNGLNNCLNFQLQSLAAAVVNRAAVQINRKAKELGIDARVQAQVHDQLIINVSEKDAEMFAPIVQSIMENTTKLPGVTLKAPPALSNNWRDGH